MGEVSRAAGTGTAPLLSTSSHPAKSNIRADSALGSDLLELYTNLPLLSQAAAW